MKYFSRADLARTAQVRRDRALCRGVAGICALVAALPLLAQEPVGGAAAAAQQGGDPSNQPAERMPMAAQSLLLGIADSDQRSIVVGERGHVLFSASRRDWEQSIAVPTRSTLTAVSAVGNQAWAVGHDGIILHSVDGGENWFEQRRDPWLAPNPDNPRHGAPLLGVLFLDENLGFAVGAYSLMLRTEDGGQNWNEIRVRAAERVAADAQLAAQEADSAAASEATEASAEGGEPEGAKDWTFSDDELVLEEESDPHLNGIARTGDGSLFVVAERGSTFRSTDNGLTWERRQLPYAGSMFGVVAYEDRHVLVFGLRGHVFESHDLGDTWEEIPTATELSLMGGAALPDGGAVLVGANGLILYRPAAGQPFVASTHPDGTVLSAVMPIAGSRELIVVGESGVSNYEPKN